MASVPSFGRTIVEPRGPVRLKLGVISDIHITDWEATGPFRAVLREFDSWGADGVMVCGDLADYGVIPQLECVARAWFEVFPDGKGRDGRPVANLMHYGDHDTRGATYRRCKPCVKMFPDEEEMKKVIIRLNDRKAIWEKCFHEPWSPIVHKRVKGYDFVLSHFTQGEKGNERGDNTPGLEKFMAGLNLDPNRPFFHSQHRVYRNTACGPHVWGQEDGTTGALFATKYPNVRVSAKRTDASASTSLDIASNMEAIPGEDKLMFAKEAFFSWGILLEVTPRVGTNGLINVSIVPTISDREDWVMTGMDSDSDSGTISTKYPVIGVQRLVTEFNLASGTTAVIGGLSVTKEEQIDTGIPLLRDIPWLGPRLFGSMGRVKTQKEIIVFVTVGLVDPHVMQPDVGLPKNAVLGRQYTEGQKLEPGDMPQHNIEGIDSLDMRSLDEQAKDPLPRKKSEKSFDLGDYVPFTKDPEYIRRKQNQTQQ